MTPKQLLEFRNRAHIIGRRSRIGSKPKEDKIYYLSIIGLIYKAKQAEDASEKTLEKSYLRRVLGIEDDRTFEKEFRYGIKDSAGDCIAQAFLATLDYAGLCDVRPSLIEVKREVKSVLDAAYYMMKIPWVDPEVAIEHFLSIIDAYCQYAGIPLLLHINLRLRYEEIFSK